MTAPRPRAVVERLHAYEEEAHAPLNLMANTNIFPPNPALDEAARLAAGTGFHELADYPSLTSVELRRVAAKHYGVDEANVVTGNGSNELIDLVVRTYAEPGDRVAFHPPTFSMIPTFVETNGAVPAPVPLGDGWRLDVDGLLAVGAKVTLVVTPNNPTGNSLPPEDVERVVREAEGLVVVDEAYQEYSDAPSWAKRLGEFPNLVVLRTLSKAHGLAGLRIGFALANPDVAAELAKVRGPFRLNAFSEKVGVLALRDDAYVRSVVEGTRKERPRLVAMLEGHGFEVFPSDANFLLTKPPTDAGKLADALLAEGVAVRAFGGDLAPFVRITVGPAEATERLDAALGKVLGGDKE